MFPRLYCCYDVNDLFALLTFGVTCCRKFPSHFHSTFEGGDGDECVVGALMTLFLAVDVVAVVVVTVRLNSGCIEPV